MAGMSVVRDGVTPVSGVSGATLVPTANGLIRVQELPDREQFQDGDARELVLRNGLRLVGTASHCVVVGGRDCFEPRRLGEVAVGDYVATSVGSEMWAANAPSFEDFTPTKAYGCQKAVRLSERITTELAFLLGAYAAEGHTARSKWTVTITNACDRVLARVVCAWESEFGIASRVVRDPGKCPGVVASSKTVVEFLEYLGAGSRASDKRIPAVILRSPRDMVLAFLQGLALDAYVTVSTAPKWGICLDAPDLLDDLQVLLANLGVMTGRVSKYNREYDKYFGEVYATGEHAQRLATFVPFIEPEKNARAAALCGRTFARAHDTADVVPGVSRKTLFDSLPRRFRNEFRFLCDPRTEHLTRHSLERVAAVPGVVLPSWLTTVIASGLHFSPVTSVRVARDSSMIATPAHGESFVGNGFVNGNAVGPGESHEISCADSRPFEAGPV
jgi:intein/homing endonuclease